MSKAKKLSLSVIFQFLNIIVKGFVGVLIVPIIINLIGQDYYGVLEIILSLMFINFFFELGMGSTLLRFIPVYHKEGDRVLNEFLWTYLYFKSFLAVTATIIIVIIGLNFNLLFNVGGSDMSLVQESVFLFAGGVFITNFASFFSNTLKGFQRFDFAVIPEIISQIFFLFLIYVFKFRGPANIDIINISILMFIVRPFIRIALSAVLIYIFIPYFHVFNPLRPKKRFLIESINFLKGMSFISLLAQFSNKAPKMILGAILNPVSVAYWGISERIKNPIQQINSSLLRPLIPMANSMQQNDQFSTNKLIVRITKIHFLLIGGLIFFILFYVDLFINLWLGNEYLYVADIIRVWFFPLILPNAGVLLMFYYAKGKTKLSQFLGMINSFLGIGLGSLLVFKFNGVGMAYGLSFSIVITTVIYFYYLCKEFELDFRKLFKEAYFPSYMVIIISFFLNFLITKFIVINNWFHLVVSVFIGVSVYFILNYFALDKSDKLYLQKIIKNIKK